MSDMNDPPNIDPEPSELLEEMPTMHRRIDEHFQTPHSAAIASVPSYSAHPPMARYRYSGPRSAPADRGTVWRSHRLRAIHHQTSHNTRPCSGPPRLGRSIRRRESDGTRTSQAPPPRPLGRATLAWPDTCVHRENNGPRSRARRSASSRIPGIRAPEPLVQGYLRHEARERRQPANVRRAPPREAFLGARLDELRRATSHGLDAFHERQHRDWLRRIADIDGHIRSVLHQAYQGLDSIVDIAKRAHGRRIVHDQGLPTSHLQAEFRNHMIDAHPRAINVMESPDHIGVPAVHETHFPPD